jgi:hypothetical protein
MSRLQRLYKRYRRSGLDREQASTLAMKVINKKRVYGMRSSLKINKNQL